MTTVLFADADQLVLRPEIKPSTDRRRRGEDRYPEVVLRHDVERVAGTHDVRDPGFAGEVHEVARHDRRRGEAVGEPFLVNQLATHRVVGADDAGVVGDVEPPLDERRRRHVWPAADRSPDEVGRADVSLAAGPEGERRPVAARHRVEQVVADDDRGHHLLRRPLQRPQLLAAGRIVAAHRLAAGEDNLVLFADTHRDRRRPRHGPRSLALPDELPGSLVERQEDRIALVLVLGEDDEVLVEKWARAGAVRRLDLEVVVLPEEVAREVVGDKAA